MKPHFLVLAGEGINCEKETAWAFEVAGGKSTILPLFYVLENPNLLKTFQGLALPGGFSYGDVLGAGRLLAFKMQHYLGEALEEFREAQKPILGICNGFQTLLQLGLLPDPSSCSRRVAVLLENESGRFLNRWVRLDIPPKARHSPWLSSIPLETLELPIRHREGRFLFTEKAEEWQDFFRAKGQIPLYYQEDVNGSFQKIAGLCDPQGLILGMMPHPEAYLYQGTYRQIRRPFQETGDGFYLFKSILRFLTQT